MVKSNPAKPEIDFEAHILMEIKLGKNKSSRLIKDIPYSKFDVNENH